jgi:hypothetical protein
MAKKYGKARLEAACKRALAFGNPKYRAVKIILEKGLDQLKDPHSAFDSLGRAYTGQGRFSRDLNTMLIH